MKNRRFAIVAFLLIAVLVMGVGYAAVTRSLSVTGKAAFGTNVANFPVKIENPTVTDATKITDDTQLQTAVHFTVGTDGITLTANVQSGMLVSANDGAEDYVTFTFDITNYSEHYKADIKDPVVTDGDYLDVTVTGVDATTVLDIKDGANDTATVTVVVKLVDLPNEDKTLEFTIKIDAVSVEG